MDSFRFVKLCRDCCLLQTKRFTVTDAGTLCVCVCVAMSLLPLKYILLDLVFQKAKKSGNYGKKITYKEFRFVLSNIPYY